MMAFYYDFRRVKTRQALLDILGIDNDTFEAVLAFEPANTASQAPILSVPIQNLTIPLFLKHSIPKRNKARGHRIVWEPLATRSHYKALSRRFDSFFTNTLLDYPHQSVYGYSVGRNIRENAMVHSGHRYLLKLDIENFFPNISKSLISDLFLKLGVKDDIAELISSFVTIGESLPMGLPTSPIISNAIALPIDQELSRLARSFLSVSYTRYADDLSFSSNISLPNIKDIKACIERHGFALAEKKTRQSKLGSAHYVTGLSVSDRKQPHVSRSKKHKLRQELYYASKFGLINHAARRAITDIQGEVNRLDGLVKFVTYHEPQLKNKIKHQWRDILYKSGFRPSFAPKNQHRAPFSIYVDESEFQQSGNKILAIGMSVSQHHGTIMSAGAEILTSELSDVWAAGDYEAIREKGMHFADATEDLRLKYISRLASMPFEGYIAFDNLVNTEDYADTYIRIFESLISRRLMAAESQMVMIYCEENSKIPRERVKNSVARAYEELKSRNDRRPRSYGVDFISKPHFGISVPDFLLGVLGKYLRSNPATKGRPEPRERLLFERLRDKYRLILDLGNQAEYSRSRQIAPWQP